MSMQPPLSGKKATTVSKAIGAVAGYFGSYAVSFPVTMSAVWLVHNGVDVASGGSEIPVEVATEYALRAAKITGGFAAVVAAVAGIAAPQAFLDGKARAKFLAGGEIGFNVLSGPAKFAAIAAETMNALKPGSGNDYLAKARSIIANVGEGGKSYTVWSVTPDGQMSEGQLMDEDEYAAFRREVDATVCPVTETRMVAGEIVETTTIFGEEIDRGVGITDEMKARLELALKDAEFRAVWKRDWDEEPEASWYPSHGMAP